MVKLIHELDDSPAEVVAATEAAIAERN